MAGLKNADRSGISNVNFSELNHYVDEGRKIKAELNDFVGIRFDELANVVANNSSICFKKRFTIYEIARNNGFCNEKKEVEDKNVELVKKMTARLKQDRQS